MPVDEVFDDYRFAALYDHFNPWSASDDFYLDLARQAAGPVLEIGCGTGRLACRIAAAGLAVTGIDPAEGMLRVAKSRPGAEAVRWIKSDGQSLDLPERFALIFMNGHVFQALITDAEAEAVLTAAARHLAPGGQLVFETRNPAVEAWRAWTPEATRTLAQTADFGRVENCYDNAFNAATGIVEISHFCRFLDTGEELAGNSRIHFIDQDHLARLIVDSGLEPVAWYGDWDRSPVQAKCREFIAVTAHVASVGDL